MEKDIDDLIDQLSLQQLKKLVSKYARLDRQLRDEILSAAHVRNASFNGLMLEEWRRRMEEAIVRDLKGELDDYYNQKIVNWDSAVATLAKAVKDFNEQADRFSNLGLDICKFEKEYYIDIIQDKNYKNELKLYKEI